MINSNQRKFYVVKRLAFIVILFFCSVQNGLSQADSSSVEWIKVYFNMPADYSVALQGNMSNSSADLIGTLETLIDDAKASVDLNIYDLEHPRIAYALARAKKRGVRIRLVTDNYNRTDGGAVDSVMWSVLGEAGIVSIDDDGDIYQPDGNIDDNSLTNSGADMHNKFAVIDALTPSPDDDYVWTGSTNLTYTGAYNTNNTIIIKDGGIAARYVEEFEQMWGSDGDQPNPQRARFHKDKREGSGNVFYVNDTKVELYFAPINRNDTKPSISDRLVEVIEKEAQHDVNFQAFAITPSIPLSQKIWEMSATGEINLNGVIDRSFYYRYKSNGDIWASPAASLTNRMILPSSELRKLHHKVMVLDGAHPNPGDQGVVITGSYNFSKNAELNNDENLLIIFSDEIANQYYQDFMGVVSRAQEKSYPPPPPLDVSQWYDEETIQDGSKFEIEAVPGFEYGVRFLGVNVPSLYAGGDSADYFADETAEFLRNVLNNKKVKIEGPSGGRPVARYGAFQAYVTMRSGGKKVALNRFLLEEGMATYAPYYAQHPDSVEAYKAYQQKAKEQRKGLWKNPDKIGTKIPRSDIMEGEGGSLADAFPININTASKATLQLLPGIGPAYAQRIIDYRNANGLFTDIEELREIRGIGPKTLEKLRANVVLE